LPPQAWRPCYSNRMAPALVGRDDGLKPIDAPPYERHHLPPDANLSNLILNWPHYKDNIVLFLGAGASVGARNALGNALPTAYHLKPRVAFTVVWIAFGDRQVAEQWHDTTPLYPSC